MHDAVAVSSGLGLALAATVVLASVPPAPIEPVTPAILDLPDDTHVTSGPAPDTACVVTGVTDVDARRALELACLEYGPGFEVFASAVLGERRVVVVRRSTGNCGGCGAFTVAVMFRGGDVEVVEKLGEFGRFGNGPDAVRLVEVAGYPAVEVDETISMGGHTTSYREWFLLDRGRLEWRLCIIYAGSDAGARERASEWAAKPWIAADGTFYSSPSYTKRGEVTPVLYAYSFPFEAGRWRLHEGLAGCIDPRGD